MVDSHGSPVSLVCSASCRKELNFSLWTYLLNPSCIFKSRCSERRVGIKKHHFPFCPIKMILKLFFIFHHNGHGLHTRNTAFKLYILKCLLLCIWLTNASLQNRVVCWEDIRCWTGSSVDFAFTETVIMQATTGRRFAGNCKQRLS